MVYELAVFRFADMPRSAQVNIARILNAYATVNCSTACSGVLCPPLLRSVWPGVSSEYCHVSCYVPFETPNCGGSTLDFNVVLDDNLTTTRTKQVVTSGNSEPAKLAYLRGLCNLGKQP
jgi:hypothetical protein